MHDVTFSVNQNVSVVTILNLEDICDQAVRCKTSGKLLLSLLVEFPLSASIVQHEVISEGLLALRKLLLDCINAHGIIDHLDKPTSISSSDDLINLHPERKVVKDEDLVDLVD